MIVHPNPDECTDVWLIQEKREDNKGTRDNAWITITSNKTKYSVNVIITDEGIVIDVHPLEYEDGENMVASLQVMDNDMLDVYAELNEEEDAE